MTESDRSRSPDQEPHAPTEARPPQRSEAGAPIAIIGMACRFPGADDIGAFWRLLDAGENAVQEGVPGSGLGRVGALFPDDTGQIDACRYGAYLDGIDRFDAAFFRISPVEAHLLDPQQRLILVTSWRALEDAGIDPDRLKDSRTGVYAGISNNDYRGLILEASENAGPAEPAASLYAVTAGLLKSRYWRGAAGGECRDRGHLALARGRDALDPRVLAPRQGPVWRDTDARRRLCCVTDPGIRRAGTSGSGMLSEGW